MEQGYLLSKIGGESQVLAEAPLMLKIKNRSSKWSTGYGLTKCASWKLLAFAATLECAFRDMQIELLHTCSPPFVRLKEKPRKCRMVMFQSLFSSWLVFLGRL